MEKYMNCLYSRPRATLYYEYTKLGTIFWSQCALLFIIGGHTKLEY